MSLTTIVFIVILLFFTWRGYQKGFVGAISRVLSFVVAYPAAIFLTKPFAAFLRSYIGLDGLILFLIAGCTIFAVTSLVVTLLLNGIARLVPHNDFTATSSKLGGAAFGLIIGGVFGLLAVYVIDLLVKPTSAATAIAQQNPVKRTITTDEQETINQYVAAEDTPTTDTFIDASAKNMVSAAASTAVGIITDDKVTSQITKVMTQDPQAMLGHVQNMTNNGELKELLNKPNFQAELNNGNVESLMQNEDFQQLIQNPDMQAIISSADDEASGKSAEQAAAEKMIQAWQKVSTLQNDPRVLEIVGDPAFQAQLNSTNKLPLLMNPKMRELSEIIFSNETVTRPSTQPKKNAITVETNEHYKIEDITNGIPQESEPEETKPADKKAEQTETKLYRWTDENGKVHFSDKPIKEKP
jgi:uncharacterized membrane protein required for colicin V production